MATYASPATLFDQLRNQARPTSLVAGADTGPIVSMKIFMELNKVAPVGVFLKLLLASVNRPAITIAQENAHEPVRNVSGHFPEICLLTPARRTFDLERVAKEVVEPLQGFHQEEVQREPDRASPV